MKEDKDCKYKTFSMYDNNSSNRKFLGSREQCENNKNYNFLSNSVSKTNDSWKKY